MPLRCGVDPGEAAVRLARRIADRPHLRFAGLHACSPRTAQHLPNWQERRQAVKEATDKIAGTRALLDKVVLHCGTITPWWMRALRP